MAKMIKICKVCGIQYEACRTSNPYDGVFRWRDVACCPEHGQAYLAAILKSREAEDKKELDVEEDLSVEKEPDVVDTEEESDAVEEVGAEENTETFVE